MAERLTKSGWDDKDSDSDVWHDVQQRLALYLAASGVPQSRARAQLIVRRLNARHGDISHEAAMHLALADVGGIEPSRANDVGATTKGAPDRAPLEIREQTIEPVTAKLKLGSIGTVITSMSPVFRL